MEYAELSPDHRISRVIRGNWQLAGGHGAIDARESIEDLIAFADAGIVTFDCADIYTGVEEIVGAPPHPVAGAGALLGRTHGANLRPTRIP